MRADTLSLNSHLQIIQKLTSLPFQKCQHAISSVDAQPSVAGGVNVFVTGQLIVGLRGGQGFTWVCLS